MKINLLANQTRPVTCAGGFLRQGENLDPWHCRQEEADFDEPFIHCVYLQIVLKSQILSMTISW